MIVICFYTLGWTTAAASGRPSIEPETTKRGIDVFLAAFSEQQKLAFLALADAVIRADDRLSQQEEAMLTTMRAEMALPEDTGVPALDVSAACAAFDSRSTRIATMLELAGLCLADGEVAPEEETLLSRIGDTLGFTAADLMAQRDWVLRQLALVHEATGMMMEAA